MPLVPFDSSSNQPSAIDERLGQLASDVVLGGGGTDEERAARASLWQFYQTLGRQSIPGFSPGWHHQEIAEFAQWVHDTPSARGMIFIPPRHGKSEIASVTLPTWALGLGMTNAGPVRRVGVVSHSAKLAEKFTGRIRDLIADDAGVFRKLFPTVRIDSAVASRAEWNLSGQARHNPSCVAFGVGSGMSGFGFDMLITDDPVSGAAAARSDTQRNDMWEWFESDARSRLQKDGRILLIMTRWHWDDLAGRLLDSQRDEWRVLHLPAIAEQDEVPDETNDPRIWPVRVQRAKGEALWPEKYAADTLAKRLEVNPRVFMALYQGYPTAAEGSVWRLDWFDQHRYRFGDEPHLIGICTAWDTAFETTSGADYSAWVRVGIDTAAHLWVLDAGRKRMTFGELKRAISGGFGYPIGEVALVERQASGRSIIQELQQDSLRPVIGIDARESKVIRATAVSHLAETGRVHVPADLPWAEELLREVVDFPMAKFDDRHDALVHAMTYLHTKYASIGRGPRTKVVLGGWQDTDTNQNWWQ